MNEEVFKKLIENQRVLDRKLDQIQLDINKIKGDVKTVISNQLILEQYEEDITDRLNRIENKLK
ncbi:hypothetical protein BC962_3269 [Gillisia mitskevichiae]|uniref:Uncharacterized protein n=1 Tax=Gillisia mitskevichiae TaxID=270921 RepID=A0A495NVN6_9FLAO|nr:hypothetical protein [Gillisia mitskevichiae]RKS42511.1 hypothetical protein BC962_3269 [Gillisia mitskevichiae]